MPAPAGTGASGSTYHVGMTSTTSRQGALAELGRSALRWFDGWWGIIHLGVRGIPLGLVLAAALAVVGVLIHLSVHEIGRAHV